MLILLAAPGLNLAQDTAAVSSRPVQVWLQRNIDDDGRDRLHFIDRRSGAATSIDLPGERYTVLREQVLYFDLADGRVRQVTASGAISDHPFIQLPGATLRVDWLVAPDASQIAWTLTEETATGQLRSFTRIAASDGSGMRDVLVDGRTHDGMRCRLLSVLMAPRSTWTISRCPSRCARRQGYATSSP